MSTSYIIKESLLEISFLEMKQTIIICKNTK